MYPALTSIVLLVAVALWSAAVVARVRITSPAADRFAGVAATAGAGATGLFAALLAGSRVSVLFAAIVVGLVLPLPWALFSFDYVGREELVAWRPASVIAVPTAAGVASTFVLFGERLLPWFTLPAQSDATGGVAVLLSALSLTQFFGLLYAGAVMLVGSGLILWTFQRYRHLDSTTGIVLVTFGTVPWVSVLFGLQIEPVSFVAFAAIVTLGFAIGAAAALALVGPFPLFERVPAAGGIGPRTVIEELTDPVVVMDGSGTVVEANAAAEAHFERGIVGRSVDDVLGAGREKLRERDTIDLTADSGWGLFEPTVSALTDQHDQPLGHAVVLRDVTSRITRQQRLEVLNRILRHNLRNDMSVIVGHGDLIRERTTDEDIAESAALITDKSEALMETSEAARDAEKVLGVSPNGADSTPVEPSVREVFDEVGGDRDGAFHYDGTDDIAVPLTREQLTAVLKQLVENAVEHNDGEPTVRVEARHDVDATYPFRIAVSDDGPGIPEPERRVIESGSESPLEHSSGIGLWIVRWITTAVGGEISFEHREPRGSTVTLHLPEVAGTEGSAGTSIDGR